MSDINPKSRKPLFLTLITVGIFLIGAGLIPLLIQGQETSIESLGIIRPPVILDQSAPQLSLFDLLGKLVSLGETRGNVVLVNNWATWCRPCQSEMPELQNYYQAHLDQKFILVAIESGEPVDVVARFVRQFGVTFQVWLDPHGAALDSFHNWDLPNSYVIDRQGTIRLSWTGPINQATLEKYVTPFLER
jgi:thiol-disulfide isomerase/thioredoxin